MRQMAEGGVVGSSQGGDVQEPIKLFAGALLKGIPAAGRFLAPYAKKLFTRPRTMERVTEGKMGQAAKDLGYLPKGQFKAPGFRQFSPGRTALTGVGIASLLSPFFMGDEEKTDMEVPKLTMPMQLLQLPQQILDLPKWWIEKRKPKIEIKRSEG